MTYRCVPHRYSYELRSGWKPFAAAWGIGAGDTIVLERHTTDRSRLHIRVRHSCLYWSSWLSMPHLCCNNWRRLLALGRRTSLTEGHGASRVEQSRTFCSSRGVERSVRKLQVSVRVHESLQSPCKWMVA